MENKVYYLNNKNIYITSNEEIKEGDWCIDKHNVVYKQETDKIFTEFTGAKKIILTTDFTLAPDVHKIPDEFLEWFVKNPSCKSVKIDLVPVNKFNSEITVGGYGFDKFIYKIIIPQEEPKQETTGKEFYESADAVITVSKQLTELEVAIKLEEIDREEYQSVKDFSRGAKWQARRMYSEEEVIKIVEKSRETGLTAEYLLLTEQFKKK
jgi:hypothetical protein